MVCSVLKRRMQWAFQEEFIRAEYILRGSHWGYSFTQHFTQSQSLPVLSVPADVLRPLPPSSLLWFLRTLREQFPRLSKISKCVSWIVKKRWINYWNCLGVLNGSFKIYCLICSGRSKRKKIFICSYLSENMPSHTLLPSLPPSRSLFPLDRDTWWELTTWTAVNCGSNFHPHTSLGL